MSNTKVWIKNSKKRSGIKSSKNNTKAHAAYHRGCFGGKKEGR